MSELSVSKFLSKRESGFSAMESCYKLYTWISHTVLMLILQIMWKMSQISDYFSERSVEERKRETTPIFTPLTKESKLRRHIRSMSDVHCSTPYRMAMPRSRVGSVQSFMYDSDTRNRRINSYRLKDIDSSDSSDHTTPMKMRNVHRIMKHPDTMRIL